MSVTTIRCPGGHSNSATQKFCGECGVSLAGICPNGHQNPGGQHYCGECGRPINQFGEASSAPAPAAMAPDPGSAETNSAPARPILHLGDQLEIGSGMSATVVRLNDDTVWLKTFRAQTSYGVSDFPRRDLEESIGKGRVTIADKSAQASGGQSQPHTDGSLRQDAASHASPSSEAYLKNAERSAAAPESTTNRQERPSTYWRGLSNRWRMGVFAGVVGVLVLMLFGSGACENSQYRQCVKDGMQGLDYYQGGGTSATKDAIQRSCERMFGK